ncbi:MAG: PAS domain S-box protein [Anaerolineae bacterium]|nr:PAS domain S-box protein [Anaerolineae bacterium]
MEKSPSENVLIISCDPATREDIGVLLADHGYRVAVAGDEAEVRAQAAESIPDLILLDIRMPDVGEACRRLRANPLLAQVPLIVLAPPAERAACLQCLATGADGYIYTPAEEPKFLAWVRILPHLSRRHHQIWKTQEPSCGIEEQCRLLVEMMPQGVLCCDAEGNILFANPAAEQLLGVTPGQVQCRTLTEPHQGATWEDGFRWTKDMLPATDTLSPRGGAREAVIRVCAPVRHECRWVGFSAVWLPRPSEDNPHLVYIFEDITQQVKAETALRQSESKFRKVIEQASDGVALADEQGRIIEWNRAQERITGLKREEVLGLPILDVHFRLVPPDRNTEPFREMLRLDQQDFFSTGQAPWLNHPLEYDILLPDGTRRIIQTVLFPVQTESGFMLGSINRDITQWIEAQREIQQRSRESAVLNEIAQAINSTLDLRETLTLITTNTNRLLNTEATSILLYDEERDDLYFAAGSGAGAHFLIGQRLPVGQGIAGWVVEHNAPALVPDVSQDPRWFSEFDKRSGFTTRSLLCVPLRSKGRIIGALETMNKEGGFDQDDVCLLSALAASAATAIENARLFEQVRNGHDQLRALSRRLVEIQETERGYIARELHDETGQALSSLLLGLSMLEQEAGNPRAVRARIASLKATVNGMLEDLHRLATDLRPVALDFLGLIPALEQYVETFSEQHGIPVEFETVELDPEDRLPPEVETALYRIVQEALTNVIRHARATRVDVLLERRNDRVIVIVEDDGVGFDVEAAKLSGRLGLLGMQERAEMLGGWLTIESTAGVGTAVFVEIPYAHSHPDRG